MRIIHCADLHLDSRMETNLTQEMAAKRRLEILNTFEKMVDYAVETGVRVIIIAGDLFDTSAELKKRIKTRVLDIVKSAPDIDFLYLKGNHDEGINLENSNGLPDNLKRFGNVWTEYIYEDICITGIEPEGETGDIYSSLSLKEENTNIVVLHGQESKYGNKNDAQIINIRALTNRYIDYLALGHIHEYKYTKLDNRGYYCYSGCLDGRGFDECGQKGYVVLEIEDGIIHHEFKPASSRVYHEVNADIGNCLNETEIIKVIDENLEGIPEKDLVKLVLCGEISEDMDIDINYIENRLSGRFYFLKVKDETRLRINYSDYKNDISLKGEFIRKVNALNIPEEDKEKIIITGIRALMGREIE